MDGVVATRVGYTGGSKDHPTYHDLGDQSESIEVTYDPSKITYQQLLDVFWDTHDPEWPSLSVQYRSAIFVHTPEERAIAEASLRLEEKKLHRKVYTTIEDAGTFWQAEDYHQKYHLRMDPKLMAEFRAMYPSDADFVGSTAAARVNGWVVGDNEETMATDADLIGLTDEGKDRLKLVVP